MYIGIPCWLIDNANPEKPIDETVTWYLRNTSELATARNLAERSLQDILEESTELYTVLRNPGKDRTKILSEVFSLSDVAAENRPGSKDEQKVNKSTPYHTVNNETHVIEHGRYSIYGKYPEK